MSPSGCAAGDPLVPSAVAVALIAVAVVLHQMTGMTGAFGSTSRLLYVLASAIVGALILGGHRGHAVGWIFSLVALTAGVNSVASEYARLAARDHLGPERARPRVVRVLELVP